MSLNRVHPHLALAALLLISAGTASAVPLGTRLTYHGELRDGASPASGVFDLQFALFQSPAGYGQIGPTLCFDNVQVVNGRISQGLDFGPVFGDEKRFLAVYVRSDTAGALACNDPSGFTAVGPAQPIDSVLFARHAQSAQEAASAGTTPLSTTADDSALLGGLAPATFANADNLTGTLPGTGLAGVYTGALTFSNSANVFAGNGSQLTGVVAATAQTATTTDTAGQAGDALLFNGLPLAHYKNLNNWTGVLAKERFGYYANRGQQFFYHQPCQFTNTANTYQGSGTQLTGLDLADVTAGTLSAGWLAGTGSSAVQFTNSGNQWAGNGAGLTALNASNFSTGTLPLANAPDEAFVVSQKNWATAWSTSNGSYADYPNSSLTFTADFSGTAVMKWNLSGWNNSFAATFLVAVIVDGSVTGLLVPFSINYTAVHQYCSGTVAFPISAGQHTVKLAIVSPSNAEFRTDDNDSVSWTLLGLR